MGPSSSEQKRTSTPYTSLNLPLLAALTSSNRPPTSPTCNPPDPSHHRPPLAIPFLLPSSTSLTIPPFLHLSTSPSNAPPLLSNILAPVSRTTPES